MGPKVNWCPDARPIWRRRLLERTEQASPAYGPLVRLPYYVRHDLTREQGPGRRP